MRIFRKQLTDPGYYTIMIKFKTYTIQCFLVMALITLIARAESPIEISANIDHSELNLLLRRYVDGNGLVDYQAWHNNPDDLRSLDQYLLQFANEQGPKASANEKVAALINAYNAFTLQWILQNYPTESIRLLKDSWSAKRHNIGGKLVSLDEIEHEYLRPLIGWRVHSAIVCAARSCPPLQPIAYTSQNMNQLIDTAYRQWLGNNAMNAYHPNEEKVEISSIFKWFQEDFDKSDGIKRILANYGPQEHHEFLLNGNYKIIYAKYHWGLNDQGKLGTNYQHSIFKTIF